MNYHLFEGNETHLPISAAKSENIAVVLDTGFGGGTLELQIYNNSSTAWEKFATFTAEGSNKVAIGRDTEFRFVLSGASGPALRLSYYDL